MQSRTGSHSPPYCCTSNILPERNISLPLPILSVIHSTWHLYILLPDLYLSPLPTKREPLKAVSISLRPPSTIYSPTWPSTQYLYLDFKTSVLLQQKRILHNLTFWSRTPCSLACNYHTHFWRRKLYVPQTHWHLPTRAKGVITWMFTAAKPYDFIHAPPPLSLKPQRRVQLRFSFNEKLCVICVNLTRLLRQ